MSTTASIAGTYSKTVGNGGVAPPASPDRIQSKFDLAIALALSAWPSLTLAVQNLWGGPDSAEKREWFAGAISDLMASTPDADVEYVEQFLLQAMNDEFDVNVDDGSGEEIAATIVGFRKLTLQGDFEKVDEMYTKWHEKQSKDGSRKLNFQHVASDEEDEDTDWDSDDLDEEDEDKDGDAEMDEVPALVRAPKEKVEPKIDEDGFMEVVSKKRR